jgi:hypothetical protein
MLTGHWAQPDLWVYSGLERAYLSRVKSGKVEPFLKSMEALAVALEVSMAQLLSGFD